MFVGSAGCKDEDKQFTQLLKEEETQLSGKIKALRKDVCFIIKDIRCIIETAHTHTHKHLFDFFFYSW